MKTMKWLLRRELWENKGSFVWAPVIAGAAMLLFMGATLLYGLANHNLGGTLIVNGKQVGKISLINAMSESAKSDVVSAIAANYLAISVPLFIAFSVAAFFYCLSALYDDRRDRSILFWKSLPVSDQMTVLSKVITAVVVAPVITIAAATATALLLVLLGLGSLAFTGVNLFGLLLGNPSFYLAPLLLIAVLPVYILWALPTVGWLLMVSAWARSKVFLWAVGVPLLTIGIIKWASFLLGGGLDVTWFSQNVVMRALLGLVPGVWLPYTIESPNAVMTKMHGLDPTAFFQESWMSLATPDAWIGVAAGAAMIFVAMRLRRWRDEG